MLTITIYCISDLFSASITTTTVTMFVKSSSLNVVKPQLSLTIISLLNALTSSNVEEFCILLKKQQQQ